MKHITTLKAPPISNGIMLAALEGHNDTCGAASTALEFLIRREGAVPFAQADPDGIFIYNQHQPVMRRTGSGRVIMEWPSLELLCCTGGPPGPVFLRGWRPHLGLAQLSRDLAELCLLCGVTTLVNLTAGTGPRAHTRPPIVSALATVPEELHHRLEETDRLLQSLGAQPNTQPAEEGLLAHACLDNGIVYLALCGHVPYYLARSPNLRVAAELARRAQQFTRRPHRPLEELEHLEDGFEHTMAQLMLAHPVLEQQTRVVEQIEDQAEAGAQQGGPPPSGGLEDVQPREMADEIDRFLRAGGQE